MHVEGSVADASDIKHVTVNGQPARSTQGSFAQWEITHKAPADQPLRIAAWAEDVNGHVEPRPHEIEVP